MAESDKTYRIFISAAEPSADVHCAGLIAALKKSGQNIEFVGVGGPEMAQASCELLQEIAGKAVMIYKALARIAHYYKLIKRISRFFKTEKIDLVIVCDSPAFNFHIAKAAKKAGIKTLFYVAPQIWAWAGWRLPKLRHRCDKLCCILPFEQDWFAKRGLDATFVGNPLFDKYHGAGIGFASRKKNYEQFDPNAAKVVIMPGSRTAEIDLLWQPMQQIALRLKHKYPTIAFTVVAVDEPKKEILRTRQIPDFKCNYVIRSVGDTAGEADFAIVASGSATLEVAAAGCPMVIMYQSSRILYHLFRWMIYTEYLSLVNILAGKELVPEFMPYFTSIDPIVEAVQQRLDNSETLAQISSDLIELTEPLAAGSAAEKTAQITIQMLD